MLEANDPTELPLSPSRDRHAREQLLSPVREDQRLDEPLGSQPVQAVHEPARLEAKSMPREVFAELCDGDRAMPANQHLENPQTRTRTPCGLAHGPPPPWSLWYEVFNTYPDCGTTFESSAGAIA